MIFSQLFNFHAFFAFFICFITVNDSIWTENFNNSVKYTIFVDPHGHGRGHFRTVQSAIDSIPPYNDEWIRIHVIAGKYTEQILIPDNKTYIYMQGEGIKKTIIVYDRHDATNTSGTFLLYADNFVAEGITFMNSYNYPLVGNKNPIIQAVAAMIFGEKCAFYRCAFIGLQDTLWDVSGRHYFKSCIIKGGIDFIFGAGQSIYENCKISVAAETLSGPGFITAHRRLSPSDSNGFVFKNCDIDGNGMAYLGRPWGPYARVIFYNCSMENVIVPLGWESYPYAKGHESQLTFAEHNCSGEGSKSNGRVKWEYKISDAMLKNFTDLSYVDSEGWLAKQPINML